MQDATSELREALAALERAHQAKLAEAQHIEASIRSLKGVLLLVPDNAALPTSMEFANMGASEAARALIKAAGRPMTTRELVDGMTQKGWRTRSRNATATLHATLANAPKEWRRLQDSGEWEYVGTR